MHPRIVEMDEDIAKGAMEKESPKQKGNSSMAGQLPHRTNDPMIKDYDTDFPEPGENPEHSGEPIEEVNQDPGERQKENQGKKKDDPLAA